MALSYMQDRRKVRVWTNDSLPCEIQATQVVEHTFEAQPAVSSNVRHAAIELLQYAPGRPLYGLLGASFTPDMSARLVIQIAVSTGEDEQVFDDSLAARVDEVRIGLPLEYVNGISAGLFETENLRALGAGVLYFGWAAHGAVGSSRAVFRRLSSDIVLLLTAEAAPDNETDMAALLQAVNRS